MTGVLKLKKKKNAKRFGGKKMILTVALVVLVLCGVCAAYVMMNGNAKPSGEQSMKPTDFIEIEIANYGTITAELYGEMAPITVTNFMKLVDEDFYDGLTFHRIIAGFMMQGGDPLGNGTGGSAEKIKGEFSANGVANSIAHERGVLSMARSMHNDSASSQFFIMHADAPHLNGQYAAFGRVLEGMDIVDQICQETPVADGNGTVRPENQPVIVRIDRIEQPEQKSAE